MVPAIEYDSILHTTHFSSVFHQEEEEALLTLRPLFEAYLYFAFSFQLSSI